jgi:hypothetical protein
MIMTLKEQDIKPEQQSLTCYAETVTSEVSLSGVPSQ